MTRYISLLRGINVGGHRKILMADLKQIYFDLGFKNVVTYIQSGNVIFDSNSRASIEAHCKRISKAIHDKYGYDVPVIIRSTEEFSEILQNNPFLDEDISKLHVTFLSNIPQQDHLEGFETSKYLPDQLKIIGNNVFMMIEVPYHKSKLTNKIFENKLNVRATNRNWKTFFKLYELCTELK